MILNIIFLSLIKNVLTKYLFSINIYFFVIIIKFLFLSN